MTSQQDESQVTTTSIVIPVYNEEDNLPELLTRLLAAAENVNPCEIILVDDGSRDGSRDMITQAAAQHPGLIVGILLNRNYGQHSAVMAGFAASRGDVVVTLDADLQNPPEEIPRIVAAIREGFDVVGSVRAGRQDSIMRKLASRVVNRATAGATGVQMTDYGCMLRGYRRHIVEAMLQCRERSTFIPALANSFARNTTEIQVAHAARTDGASKYSLWNLINLQFDLLTSTSKFPLRFLSIVGAAISVFGIGFGVLLMALRFLYGAGWAAEGVFTLFAILFIFVGAQFIGLGLLGEYLGRVYDDVRARPRYFVSAVEGQSRLTRVPPRPPADKGEWTKRSTAADQLNMLMSEVNDAPEEMR
jgi:undecaprenyl-phosphate 4-deoxy-4-formamido-L-arabinose transferase